MKGLTTARAAQAFYHIWSIQPMIVYNGLLNWHPSAQKHCQLLTAEQHGLHCFPRTCLMHGRPLHGMAVLAPAMIRSYIWQPAQAIAWQIILYC